MISRKYIAVSAVLMLGLAGCGNGRPPLKGTVAFPDGAALTKGELIFDDGTYSDFAAIDGEGRFVVDNGLPAGTYKVLIQGAAQGEYDSPRPLVDKRYFQPETTDLEVVIGEKNAALRLTVDRPPKK